MTNNRQFLWIAAAPSVLLVAVAITAAVAGQVTIQHGFAPGTVADANQVNQNFNDVATEINDNDTRIGDLETALAALTTRVDYLESNPGIARAIVRVTPRTDGSIFVAGFNNLPGGSTPTVTRTAAGRYTVDFGISLAGGRWFATAGRQNFIPLSGEPLPLSAGQVMISVHQSGTHFTTTSLDVRVYNDTGADEDAPIFLAVY